MAQGIDIACLQTRPQAEFSSALDEALPLAEAAVQAGADMIFLPEYCGGLASDGARLVPPVASENSHPVLSAFRDFARSHKVWVLLGSIAVEGPAGKFLNRGYMIDDAGDLRGHYDKIHLFDVEISPSQIYRESDSVCPGTEAVIYDTPWGRIGHTICYDLRFAGLYRTLAKAGADILCCPAAFTKTTGEAHWHVLNRARAIETGCYMVAPCAIGPVPGGGESYGHSLVVNPWGEVVADGGTLPGVVSAHLDLDKVAETRARIPSLTHDRDYAYPGAQKRNIA